MTMRSTLTSQFVLTLILFGLSPVMAQSTTFDASAWPGASVACISALSASVSCNIVLSSLYGSSYYTHWDLDSLESICQPDCYTSLQAHSVSVLSACGSTQYYNEPSNSYYLPNILDLQMLYAYGETCMDSNGAYCETYFQNSTAQSLCDDCWLKLYQFKINNALDGVDDDLVSSFVALTQSCLATQYPTTSPTPALVTSSTAAVATCTGSTYQVQSTDTMYSVSVSQRISTNILLNINGLSYNESDFPTSGTLCINNQCDIHIVSASDTCTSIANVYGISNSNLLTWNSNINPLCTNLGAMLNDTICISNPFPTATTITPTSTTATSAFPYTFSAQSATRVPFTKWEDLWPEPTSSPIPLANGTRTDCISYIALANSSELNCWKWADLNGIRRSDFVNWNPSLDPSTRISGPAYSYSCTLAPSSSYCLELSATTTTITPDEQPTPTPTLPDQINQCYDWIRPWDGYTCDDALDETGLTFARFYEMNPSIQSDCSQLIVNMWYCAASHNYSRPAVIPASTTTSDTTASITASSTTASTATSCTATSVAVTLNELVTTIYGQTIKIVGSIPELASWDSANAIALSADSYTSSNPLWSVTIPLALGTVFEYKYINVASDGTVTWEADPNETFTIPATCTTAVTISNTWR